MSHLHCNVSGHTNISFLFMQIIYTFIPGVPYIDTDIVGYIAANLGYETYKFLYAMRIVGILVIVPTTITDTILWSYKINMINAE